MIGNFLKGGVSVGVAVALVVAVVCFVPMVFLWAVNSLSEAGGSSFYIDHSLYNYLVAFVAVAVIRGS